MPALTAVIPTHNRPEQLIRAIDSVLNQSFPTELVVVDDGSDLPVDADLLPLGAKLIRHDVPQGSATARNAGASAAETEWIGFLDDDDLWLPTHTEAVLDAAGALPEAKVIFNRTSWEVRPGAPGVAVHSDPAPLVLHRQPPHISGVHVRRDIHQRSPFDETMWATQDVDYLIRLAAFAPWVEIKQVLSVHGDRRGHASAVSLEARIAGRLSLLEKHGDLIRADKRSYAFYLTRLGHQYRRAGQMDNATQAFKDALRKRPSSVLAWKGLVRTIVQSSGS